MKNSPGTMPASSKPNRTNTLSNSTKTKTPITTNSSKIPTPPLTKGNKSSSNNSLTTWNAIGINTSTSHPALTTSTSTAIHPTATATYSTVTTDNDSRNLDKTNYTQPISNNAIIDNADKTLNFASIAAKEITPNREQAIVFNSIDGIPQKEYVIAIGQIVQPKNISFISRISNNRFCIFLNSKEILDSLMSITPVIVINGHEIQLRRLLNPAKRIVISNVCPSIPNTTILQALQSLDIIPASQINHLKAGINIKGYEHILSFRRQIYIKHEDIQKLPGSLILNHNQAQFRIFFTDDTITCYTCHKTGHTSNTCKKDILNEPNIQPSHDYNTSLLLKNTSEKINEKAETTLPLNSSQTHDTTGNTHIDWLEDITIPTDLATTPTSPTAPENSNLNIDKANESVKNIGEPVKTSEHNLPSMAINDKNKRPLSETTSSPKSPTTSDSTNPPTINNKPNKKKPKISSRSNSFSQEVNDLISDTLKPAESLFLNTNNDSISLLQFQYIIENFTNKSLNIHTLCKQVNSDIPTILEITEKIRTKITDSKMKSKLTRLSNLLFQSLPPSNSN